MKTLNLIITALMMLAINATAQKITTIAGVNGDGATAKAIGINPVNVAIDKAGNIYISDPEKHLVRKLSVAGIYSTVAGTGIAGYSGDGGLATSAQLDYPYNVALDSVGNLYITDSYVNRVRKVAVNGTITTIAGNGTAGFSGDGGLATAAQINGANAVAADNKGNVYITDFSNSRVRKIDKNGIISTVAGNGSFGAGGDGGPATSAQISFPLGIAVNKVGELFITDVAFNNVRKVSVDGIISTIAGSKFGPSGFSGDGGLATDAVFNQIGGSVALDSAGNIFIPDSRNNRIRKIDVNGIVTTVAGDGTTVFTGDGGQATNAGLNNPTGIAMDATGNIYVATDFRIRKVDKTNIISSIAGNGSGGYNGDGILAKAAQLYFPAWALPHDGNLLIGGQDYRVRSINAAGIITTIAGTGAGGFSGDGGPATAAQISNTSRAAADKFGNIFIADGVRRIRKISADGTISTVAGDGTYGDGGDGGLATAAQFRHILGIAVDGAGNLYIADVEGGRVRKVGTGGIINTIAGNGTDGFGGDGGPATAAELFGPQGLVVDGAGNIFIADAVNNRVRKVSTDGIITTVAGNGSSTYSGDGGSAVLAGLSVTDIAIDPEGNLFIADASNERIRKVDTNGIITTLAGGGSTYGDGGPATAFALPISSVSADSSGNVYFTDYTNHRVRKISGGLLPLTLLTFNAWLNNNDVVVTWQTANEVNTDRYTVERSKNGSDYAAIGTVPASNSKGYGYTDVDATKLNAPALFYRLKMIDKDGKYTFSKVAAVPFGQRSFGFSIYPNPAKASVIINGSGIKFVAVLDMAGKTLISQPVTGNNPTINTAGLAKGVYIVRAYNNSGIAHDEKLLVQ